MKKAYRDVNDTPDATLAVLLEDFADLVALGEVDGEGVDLCAVLVLFCGIGREVVARDLSNTLEGLGTGVVVVIDRDDLVPPRLLEREDDVRACGCVAEERPREVREQPRESTRSATRRWKRCDGFWSDTGSPVGKTEERVRTDVTSAAGDEDTLCSSRVRTGRSRGEAVCKTDFERLRHGCCELRVGCGAARGQLEEGGGSRGVGVFIDLDESVRLSRSGAAISL